MAPYTTAQLIVADGLNWDLMTGRVTAFNLLEEVQGPREPALLPRLGVLVIYTFEEPPRGFEERIRIIGPTPKHDVVITSVAGTKITPSTRHHNSLHTFTAVQLPKFGDYHVVAEHADEPGNWVKTAQRRLIFSQAQPAHVTVAPTPS